LTCAANLSVEHCAATAVLDALLDGCEKAVSVYTFHLLGALTLTLCGVHLHEMSSLFMRLS